MKEVLNLVCYGLIGFVLVWGGIDANTLQFWAILVLVAIIQINVTLNHENYDEEDY